MQTTVAPKTNHLVSGRFLPGLAALATAALLAGCGGGGVGTLLGGNPGGTGSSGGGGNPGLKAQPAATAAVHVDVPTGKVTVTPMPGGKAAGRAVFAGSAITLNSSDVLDLPGNAGVKVLNVSITNHQPTSIGIDPNDTVNGVRVLFGPIANVSNLTSDLRTKVNVSTIAGTGSAGSADGAALSATMTSPLGVAPDGLGALYFTTLGDNRVRKLSAGNVTTIAGGGSDTTNGFGATAAFSGLVGIAYNPADQSLAVTEYYGNRIRRVTPQGSVSLIAGTGTSGETAGTGATATFTTPQGIAADSAGNIYVADAHMVRKITYAGTDRTNPANYTVANLAGSATGGYADGNGAAARFGLLTGITVDPAGNLYVSDSSVNAIRRIDSAGNVTTISGTTNPGSTDGNGALATYRSPQGIAFTQGALIVSDGGNNRIRLLTLQPGANPAYPASWLTSTLSGAGGLSGAGTAGFVDGTGDVAQMNSPQLLCADAAGNVTVADYLNNRLRRLQLPANFNQIGVGNGAVITEPVQLSNADGRIAGDASVPGGLGYLLYGGSLAAGATSPARSWSFIVPAGVTAFEFTITVEGAVPYSAPPDSNVSVGPATVVVHTLAGGTGTGYTNGSGPAATFYAPNAVAVDSYGNIFVADTQNFAVRRLTPAGTVSTVLGVSGAGQGFADGFGNMAKAGYINGLCVSPNGAAIYFTDSSNHRIRRATKIGVDPTDPASWLVSTIVGTGTAGAADGVGTTATLNQPMGIALDVGGNLFVSEFGGNRVRMVAPRGGDLSLAANWYLTLVAGDNSAAAGASGSANGVGNAARFFQPQGVAVSTADILYVGDTSNQLIRAISLGGHAVSTVAGNGNNGRVDGPATSAEFSFPQGITVDNSGYLYVADSGNNLLRVLTPGGTVRTVAGSGTGRFVDGSGSTSTFFSPSGLALDCSGTIYVADNGNNAIRIVQRTIVAGSN